MPRLTPNQVRQLPPYIFDVQKSGDSYYSLNAPETLYLSRAGLKRAGWPDKLIDALLPKPCRRAENPHNPHSAPMALYSLARIQKIEQFGEASDQVTPMLSKLHRLAQTAATLSEQPKIHPQTPTPRPRPNDTSDLKSGVQMQQLGIALELAMQAEAMGDLARDF